MVTDRKSTWRTRKGMHYEEAALAWLRRRGLRLIERNYRCAMGEIDLVMQDGAILIFIEVRFRASNSHGAAYETVDWRKQQKLLRSARCYLAGRKQFANWPCRFDVVGICLQNQGMQVTWIKDAFQ